MLPEDVAEAKAALRAQQRERLGRLGLEERRARSEKLLGKMVALSAWQGARRVLMFAPLPQEPDLDLLWTSGALAGKQCAYPSVAGVEMQLVPVDGLADLRPGRWGLREPVGSTEIVPLGEFDLVLVPGLAFDATGGRLGRGGGFYDRLLAQKPAGTRVLGVAFAFQVVPELPLAAHDIRMDAVITD